MTKSDPKGISGHWRITWMQFWDQDYVDLVEPGYIRIEPDGKSEFQFGVVTGGFDTTPVGTYFNSTWEGSQECDEVRGEIYGTVEEEGDLYGCLSFFKGDESEYKAVRIK